MKTLKMTILNNKKLPITLKHLTIVDCTLYRPIRSVTLVKSIGSAKPGKARVINFKARVKPEARALEKTGLFSITTDKFSPKFGNRIPNEEEKIKIKAIVINVVEALNSEHQKCKNIIV